MTETESPEVAPTTPTAVTEVIDLDEPLNRGKQSLTQITVRKPNSGTLRGVTLVDVINMDVMALTKVLPRVTDPALTEAEIRTMDPADLVQLGTAVSGFLLAKKYREPQS